MGIESDGLGWKTLLATMFLNRGNAQAGLSEVKVVRFGGGPCARGDQNRRK